MLTLRVLATAASAALLLAISPTAQAADVVGYRGLRLGMTLVAAGKVPGTVPGEATVIHKRPALLQELRWRPGSTTSDSVQEALLSFFNGELSRSVVTYDRYRVEGLTSQDMIDGISQIYGSATTPKADIPLHSIYGESAAVIARWQEADSSWNLVRTGDGASFALVGLSMRREALSQAAVTEADRLDAAEAPQREAARQAKRDADESSARDKARTNNKSGFRP
jgi:hypothetical protein